MELKKHTVLRLAAIAWIFGSFSASVQATPIVIENGSFETPGYGGSFTTLDGPANTTIDGWVINGSIDYIGSYWQAADGNQSLDMNGLFNAGSIEQQITISESGNVRINFSMSGNPDDPGTKTLYVSLLALGGTQVFTFDATANTHSNMGWLSKTAYFADIPQGNYILRFSGMGSIDGVANDSAFGPALDNVSASVPDGGMSVGLLGMSFTGLAYFRRRLSLI